jgi:hypothetical protein
MELKDELAEVRTILRTQQEHNDILRQVLMELAKPVHVEVCSCGSSNHSAECVTADRLVRCFVRGKQCQIKI